MGHRVTTGGSGRINKVLTEAHHGPVRQGTKRLEGSKPHLGRRKRHQEQVADAPPSPGQAGGHSRGARPVTMGTLAG